MKLSWETRLERLAAVGDILRGQLPFIEPSPSARAQMRTLLAEVDAAHGEVIRRLALKRRRDMREITEVVITVDGPVRGPLAPAAIVNLPPVASALALALPTTASWRPAPEGPLEYEVVWNGRVAS